MDGIALLKALHRRAHAGNHAPEAFNHAALWDRIDRRADVSEPFFGYFAAVSALAASVALAFAWDSLGLMGNDMLWVEPVARYFQF